MDHIQEEEVGEEVEAICVVDLEAEVEVDPGLEVSGTIEAEEDFKVKNNMIEVVPVITVVNLDILEMNVKMRRRRSVTVANSGVIILAQIVRNEEKKKAIMLVNDKCHRKITLRTMHNMR